MQMPVVDPGNPGNSYLLYKLLRHPQSHRLSADSPSYCKSRYPAALPPDCLAPPVEELDRLREWFVLGDPMPPVETPVSLHRPEVQELISFVAAGARCR
jgi:hypothetical protein